MRLKDQKISTYEKNTTWIFVNPHFGCQSSTRASQETPRYSPNPTWTCKSWRWPSCPKAICAQPSIRCLMGTLTDKKYESLQESLTTTNILQKKLIEVVNNQEKSINQITKQLDHFAAILNPANMETAYRSAGNKLKAEIDCIYYKLLNGNGLLWIFFQHLNSKIYIAHYSDQLNSPILTYLLPNHQIFCNWNYPTSLTAPSSPCCSTCPWYPLDPSSDSLNYTQSCCPFLETTPAYRIWITKYWLYLLQKFGCPLNFLPLTS